MGRTRGFKGYFERCCLRVCGGIAASSGDRPQIRNENEPEADPEEPLESRDWTALERSFGEFPADEDPASVNERRYRTRTRKR